MASTILSTGAHAATQPAAQSSGQSSGQSAVRSAAGQPVAPGAAELAQARVSFTTAQPAATTANASDPATPLPASVEIAVKPAPPNQLPVPLLDAAATAPATPAPPSPAAQVAQTIAEPVKLALTTPAQQTNGPQVLSIKLDPIELGKVEVRIERTGNGPARVDLVAERPETLQRLVHDQPQLQQMLDQAGVPASGRSLHFSLATDTPTNASAGFTAGNQGGNGQPGGGSQRSPQGYPNGTGADADLIDHAGPAARSARAGLDITA